ncbi:MAG: hypothetical protein K6C95_00880 [Lachnospiraceae bacterium]|nr:hypothetical protein [Lachnospiraceae bacterium]
MKKKEILRLTACMVSIILFTGCGKNENVAGRTTVNNQNSVQAVLEQGMSDTENKDKIEVEADMPEQYDPIAAENPQSLAQDNAPSVPVSEPAADTSGVTDEGFIDLTALSGTMVYSEVYNMMYYPENYVGKTVRMSGMYSVYHDESTDKYYHACIISDATACCSQGIEFELTDDYTYPDDYPENGGQICVEGVFDTYQEGEYTYCTLRDSRIK